MRPRTGWAPAALASLLAAAAALVGWLLWGGVPQASGKDPGQASATPVPAAKETPVAVPVVTASAPARTPPAQPGAGMALPPGHVAVCQAAPVPRERPLAEVDSEMQREIFPALQAALAGLAMHPEPRMRAAGHMLALHSAYLEGASKAQSGACRDGAACPKPWDAELLAHTERAVQQHLDLLVRQALDSRDAAIYGIALQTCAAPFLDRDSGACRQLSAAEWARLEPDNRQVWWRVAAEAEQRAELQVRDAALATAIAAPRDDSHLGVVVRAALAAVPETANGQLQTTLVLLVSGAWSTSMVATPPVLGLCKAERLGDSNLRQPCERLAEVLTRQPATMVELIIGKGLGRRLGWPAERLPATTERQMRQGEALNLLISPEDDPFSCRTVAHQRRWLADLGRLGEIGAADLLVERSGADPEALRRRGEARMAALVSAAQAAASAAVAPEAGSAPTR